ncbi:hypothetical protein P4B35_23460 [Pontiellaceae bacterium B12227]|nr:hypothetical protein [Pontiellaceae bacterium B12227]
MKYTKTRTSDHGSAEQLSGACSSIPAGALLPAEMVTEFIKGIFLIDSALRDVVGLRFLGATYREIGEQLGISTQLAEIRHRRALREWPAFEVLFADKVAKQSRRKGRA